MNNEEHFNPSDVTPAKVEQEHLDESTPKEEEQQVAPESSTPPVHADQDSERYKHLQAAYTKVTQENSELKGRFEALEAKVDQQRLAQPTPQSQFDLTPDDAMEAAAKDVDVLKPVTSNVRKIEQKLVAQQKEFDDYRQQAQQREQQTSQQAHEQRILSVHPDVFEISKTMEFSGWLVSQPSYMQRLMKDGSADEIIDLFSAYKGSTSKVDEAKQASSPTTSSAPLNTNNSQRVYTSSEVDAMSDAEFIKHEAAIDKAILEGNYRTG